MSEGGEIVEGAAKRIGLFDAAEALFRTAPKTGAEDVAKRAETAKAFLDAGRAMSGRFRWIPSGLSLKRIELQFPYRPENSFIKWLIKNGPEPGPSGAMNCWEAVMLAAHRAGLVSKERLRGIHLDAQDAAAAAGSHAVYYRRLKERICPGPLTRYEVDPVTRIGTTDIPAGSVLFMDHMNHVMVSCGTRDVRGHLQVLSHWDPWFQVTTLDKVMDWDNNVRAILALKEIPTPHLEQAATDLMRDGRVTVQPIHRARVFEFGEPFWLGK